VWGGSEPYPSATFAGALDELAVYGTALSELQVRAHYDAAQAR